MSAARDSFRVAIRKFDPFEAAIREHWFAFAEATGCSLHLETVALDLHDLHQALFETGGLRKGDWDVAFIVTDWLAEAREGGDLLDLRSRLRSAPPLDYPVGWTDSLLRHQRFGETVLGVPFHDGPECLIYRKDLLEAAGAVPPTTWEEFHSLARRLSAPAKRQWGTAFAGFPDGHNTAYDFCLQLWTRGGELFDRAGKIQLCTPAAEAALTFYRTILGDAAAVHPDCARLDSVQAGLAFCRGEIAMMINWFGFAALGETMPDSRVRLQVGVAPLPSAPGCSSASLNVYWLLGIGAGSPHADPAYEFIRHCAGPEGDKRLTLGGGIGCRRSTWHDPEVHRAIPFYPILESLHAHARELPRLSHWAKIAAVIDHLVTQVATTTRPIGELCRQAQLAAEKL